eukprot:TRINITY_DN111434_c0_g1_i1.p1 TRINITY_DN111434_c0_g1~~TRINITY_DN111434_c0_g1_i1.p1  ORF type:complete len:960 (+),score=188.63 TRINITY_DN111434_c0_g1_i1:138-3017(+)
MWGDDHFRPQYPMSVAAEEQAARVSDVMQLAQIAAAASSAAASTAHAVDIVVNEAVLFFATMPPGHVGEGSEVFKSFGKRAHGDASAAAEACQQVHQMVARYSSSEDDAFIQAAARAAAQVSSHTDKTVAIAREAAELCMGIVEEAGQANASQLARDTAKRCLEQAIQSIKVASETERQSLSLRELLARVGGAGERRTQPAALSSRAPPGVVSASSLTGAALQQPRKSSAPRVRRRWFEQDAKEIARLVAALPSDTSAGRSSGSRSVPDSTPAPAPPAATWCLEDAINGVSNLNEYLAKSCRLCMEAGRSAGLPVARRRPSAENHGGLNGVADADGAEDDEALHTIVEWRYGQALSSGCKEEEILSDVTVAHLAYSERSPEEPIDRELAGALRGCSPPQLRGLVSALQASRGASVRNAEGYMYSGDVEEAVATPFPGAFVLAHQREQPLLAAAEAPRKEAGVGMAPSWDGLFDKLGWTPSASSTWKGSSPDSVAAIASSFLQDNLSAVADEDKWTVDGMTLRQLHLMSMRSRCKQRRSTGTGKQKGGAEDGVASYANAGNSGALGPDEDTVELRNFLQQVFGLEAEMHTLDDARDCLDTSAFSMARSAAAARGAIGGVGAQQLTVVPATTGQASTRRSRQSAKKRAQGTLGPPGGPSVMPQSAPLVATSLAPGGPTASSPAPRATLSIPAACVSAAPIAAAGEVSVALGQSPAHRLIEPPQLLHAALTRHKSPDEDQDDDEDFADITGRDHPPGASSAADHYIWDRDRVGGSLLNLPSLEPPGLPRGYLPGELLRRLPRTFHESMEHIAVQRREAYGMPARLEFDNWRTSPSAAMAGLPENRARTFNEGSRMWSSKETPLGATYSSFSPINTPAGPYIRTPTWTSVDSTELIGALKDDPFGPLYVQARPKAWASEHCEEVSVSMSSGSGAAQAPPHVQPSMFTTGGFLRTNSSESSIID